jgi:mRNA interferase YafQ
VLNLKAVSQFKKDFKKYRHNEPVLEEFEEVIKMLRSRNKLPEKYVDHSLGGQYKSM